MAGVFEEWITHLRLSWMGERARRIWGGFAAVLGDKVYTQAQQANFEHMPELAKDPASLGLLASERGIETFDGEPMATLAARVVRANQLWRAAGTPIPMLLELNACFPASGPVVVQQNGRYWELTNFGYDLYNDLYSPEPGLLLDQLGAFLDGGDPPSWLVAGDLGPNPAIPASADGKPAIAAGTVPWWTFDSGMDAEDNQYNSRFGLLFLAGPDLSHAEDLARVKRIIARWKPAKSKCMGIWVALDGGPVWGVAWDEPDFNSMVWGSFTWGGSVTYYAI
jgi:hypothetical protein